MIHFTVEPENAGRRLDVVVQENMTQLSRSSVHKLFSQDKITMNETPAKPGYKLRGFEKVAIDFTLETAFLIPDIKLPILYEDDDCLVINKPEGVLTHSKGAFNPEGTVASFIVPKLINLSGERAGIVHRLDRATSGVIICAKHQAALTWLQKQFSVRKVKKTYIAIINGTLDPPKALIDMPIERNPKNPKTFRVGAHGKPAQTEYTVIKSANDYSQVLLRPTTGRTHQLRVHLSHLGHPIVGDSMYDGEPSERLYLHAQELELTLPNRERKIFSAPLPDVFASKLQNI